ncbi:unnamed protein product [Rhizophagus irregularis]|nr:unnamed protein product [Rhizophagus irregularis]
MFNSNPNPKFDTIKMLNSTSINSFYNIYNIGLSTINNVMLKYRTGHSDWYGRYVVFKNSCAHLHIFPHISHIIFYSSRSGKYSNNIINLELELKILTCSYLSFVEFYFYTIIFSYNNILLFSI